MVGEVNGCGWCGIFDEVSLHNMRIPVDEESRSVATQGPSGQKGQRGGTSQTFAFKRYSGVTAKCHVSARRQSAFSQRKSLNDAS